MLPTDSGVDDLIALALLDRRTESNWRKELSEFEIIISSLSCIDLPVVIFLKGGKCPKKQLVLGREITTLKNNRKR
jgi:hypothetical protein